MTPYPLIFAPVYKDYLWGGDRLARFYGRQGCPSPCAESWEVSDHPDGTGVVANGPLAGTTLAQLVATLGNALVGTGAPRSGRFPLLVKLIDARERLSLQVHPDDATAPGVGGEAKSEAWCFLEGAPDATVMAGFTTPVLPAQFPALLRAGMEQRLGTIAARAGSAVYIPGGCLHAIGAGCLILEVQQNSNTTYRVHDWGRTDASGRPRPLHVEEAMKVINWSQRPPVAAVPRTVEEGPWGTAAHVIESPYFRISRLTCRSPRRIEHDGTTFSIIFSEQETVRVASAGGTVDLARGATALVPAAVPFFSIEPQAGPSSVLRVTLPPPA